MPFDLFKFLSLELSEYLEQIICECFEDDDAYRKDMKLIEELSDTLSEDQPYDAPINQLTDAIARQESFNRDAVYWQGWKDCVKLLQKVELLPILNGRSLD